MGTQAIQPLATIRLVHLLIYTLLATTTFTSTHALANQHQPPIPVSVLTEQSTFGSRRSFVHSSLNTAIASCSLLLASNCPAVAADDSTSTPTTSNTATITDKIYLDIKGLPPSPSSNNNDNNIEQTRITIGLFGNDAPDATYKLKQLLTNEGLPAPCKPNDATTRLFQKEQLEANKVFNACKESEQKGVNYDYSTIWRIVKDEKIDLGAVSGKYISRETVDWTGTNNLKHDAVGVVSVKRGNDSGFGFTIFTGSSETTLDDSHIVVGRVIHGLETIQQINQVPVVKSTKLGGTGGEKSAPSRACRYGSNELYCNEFKPLQKLSISNFGIISK